MNIQRLFLLAILSSAMCSSGGCSNNSGHDDHSDQAEHDDHDDHGEEGDQGEEGGHEDLVRLSAEQLRLAGVVIMPLGGGEIATHVMLPAEVGLNLDTVVHVTPRVPGIVSAVEGFLGHNVVAGDLLAVLESPELGEAKIAFLQSIQSKLIADSELDRQETISVNTEKLLDVLRDEPTLDALRNDVSGLLIGENKGRLLSAYAQMKAGRANFAREQELNTKGLSTQADLVAAEESFHSAQAQYMAAFEDVDFSFRLKIQDAQQSAMIATSGVENAERRLHLLGLSQAQVEGIATEPDANVARYELAAPMSGRIVTKHITPGEMVGTNASVYTIADLSTVWLNISIYSQYSGMIEEGQHVTVRVNEQVASGVVDYISAIVSETTRTIAARVVLDNQDGAWRPGVFVTVRVETDSSHANRVVPIDAVQTYEGNTVVFIQDADGIEPVAVTLGRRSDVLVELLGDDVAIGTPIVVVNSFLMKAELGKSSAGHQH